MNIPVPLHGSDGDGVSIIIRKEEISQLVGLVWVLGKGEVSQNHALHVTVLIATLLLAEMERMRSRPK